PELVRGTRHRDPGHPAREAEPERVRRALQQELPRGAPRCLPLRDVDEAQRSRTSGCSTTRITGRTTRSEASLRRATCPGPYPGFVYFKSVSLTGTLTRRPRR